MAIHQIDKADIQRRIELDNPWWATLENAIPEARHKRRAYFDTFKSLSLNFEIKRATVLMGPRRVGKTFMIKQLIHEAVGDGIHPKCILYASIDTPIYSGIHLRDFLDFMPEVEGCDRKVIIFDEIQYLKDWESHLKNLGSSGDRVGGFEGS